MNYCEGMAIARVGRPRIDVLDRIERRGGKNNSKHGNPSAASLPNSDSFKEDISAEIQAA